MKENRVILRGQSQIALVAEMIGLCELDGTMEVIIRPHKKDRSYEQNRLYWRWLTEMGMEVGNDSQAQHEAMKRKFLIPILQEDPEFFALCQIVQENGTENDRRQMVKCISTSKLSVRQFTRYLDQIHAFANSLGISLTEPL